MPVFSNSFPSPFGTASLYPEGNIKNVEEMREYLRNISEEDVNIGCFLVTTKKDLPAFTLDKEMTAEYSRETSWMVVNDQDNKLFFSCNSLVMALLLGETDAARRIVKMIGSPCLKERRYLTRFNTFMSEMRIQNPVSLESFLYNLSNSLPDDLKEDIIAKIEEIYPDGYEFNYSCVRLLKNAEVRRMLAEDNRRHPGLFAKISYDSAMSLETMYYLSRVNSGNETRLIELTEQNRQYLPLFQVLDGAINPEDMKYLTGISQVYKRSEKLKRAFFDYVLRLFFNGIRNTGNNSDEISMHHIWNEEKMLKMIGFCKNIAPSENDYQDILDNCFSSSLEKPYAYKLGRVIYNRKFDLLVNENGSKTSAGIYELFGTGGANSQDFGIGMFTNTMTAADWFDFFGNVGRIRTRSGEPLKRVTAYRLLEEGSDIFRDVFLILMEKGLFNGTDINYIIRNAIRSDRCRYLVPMLILLKDGGIKTE